jgi:hypothetical protein
VPVVSRREVFCSHSRFRFACCSRGRRLKPDSRQSSEPSRRDLFSTKFTTSQRVVEKNETFTICYSQSAPYSYRSFSLFTQVNILGLAAALTIAAIIGKQICALGVVERGINRVAVGLGMIPRGEVGLIFAGIGATLMLPSATGEQVPVISSAIFGAVVMMVIITTLITPITLKWALGRKPKNKREG